MGGRGVLITGHLVQVFDFGLDIFLCFLNSFLPVAAFVVCHDCYHSGRTVDACYI